MARTRRLVIDLLKPHESPTRDFASQIADLDGVSGANAVLIETDKDVQNVKITAEGDDVRYEAVEDVVTQLGGTIHSVDEVACGDVLVEESRTPQD